MRSSDVDVERGAIRWREGNDKIGYGHVTPLPDEARDALLRWRSACPAVGDAGVFPSDTQTGEPCSRHVFQDAWRRAAALPELPRAERFGWHSLRRKFATELKQVPLRDLAHLGGWKCAATILTCYQQPAEATQRAGLACRTTIRASAR